MLASHFLFIFYVSIGTSSHLIPFTQYKAYEFTVFDTLIEN